MLVDIEKLKNEIEQYQDNALKDSSEEAKEIVAQITIVTLFILSRYNAELEKVIDQRVQEAILHSKG